MITPAFQPIAITGLSALFPQARSLDEFWRLILSGRDCMTEIPRTHWLIEDYYDADPKAPAKTYSRHGAFLQDVPFDPVAYGIPPNLLPSTDIAQVLALMLARHVLEDTSGGQVARLQLDRTSVILGVASATEMISSMSGLLSRPMWIEGMRRAGIPEPQVQAAAEKISALFPDWNESTFPGCLGNVVAGRVANRFNLGGTNCVTDAACASSLAALHLGMSELQLGLSDRVISGGVDALNTIFMYMCFSKTPAMSASGKCSPFSAAADGTMMGEGGGMLVLRRLEDAERDGDPIYAVIRGLGSSSDGRSKSVYAPRPEGQAVALQRCYAQAGYSPATVGLVEAHGTGTAAGDLCEATALKEVFAAAAPGRAQWCALGSIKSQIGHTKGAAGSAGLIKVALALRHRVLPPTANVAAPNPKLGFEGSPLYLSTQPRPWIEAEGTPRRGSVSSFGFGGTNFHVALEEYRGAWAAPRVRAFGVEVLLASGVSAAELAKVVAGWAGLGEGAALARTAQASQRAFDAAQPWRAAIVATTAEQLTAKVAKLRALLDAPRGETAPTDDIYLARGTVAAGAAGVAFLFPGQGSQSVGMAAEVPLQFAPAMAAWERVEGRATPGATRLCDLVYPVPAFTPAEVAEQETILRRTENAQPALGAVSLGYLAVLGAAGVRPALTGGHSFGEVVALHAAGVIDRDAMMAISRRRGALMAEVSQKRPGAMTAVLHAAAEIEALLGAELPGCVVANYNSPQQSVVAGPVDEMKRLEAALTAKKISFRRLPVATAFHSTIVADACRPFAEFLDTVEFAPATVPVFGNTTGDVYPATAPAARAILAAQLAKPVRFADQLRAMQIAGAKIWVEVGAGAVLTGLARQTLGDEATLIALNPKGKPADVGLLCGLARLAVAGVPVTWEFLWAEHRTPKAEEKLSAATLPVGGYNLNRPYPPRDGVKTAPVPLPPPAPVNALPAPAPKPTPAPMPTSVAATPRSLPLHSIAPSSVSNAPADSSVQAAVARAHETFLRTIGDAHRAYLSAMTGAGVVAALPTSTPTAPPVVRPTPPPVRPTPAPVAQTEDALPAPAPLSPKPMAKSAPSPVAVAPAAPTLAPSQVIEVVLATVAAKTGYPREMLEPGMQLESDLGIDSIKRVEILSAVQEKLPGLPAVDAKVMGGLQTLQAISDYLGQALGAAAASAPSPAVATARVANSPVPTLAPAAVMPVVLETVAEKTGYPLEMLEPGMQLESDLGIDSIKRVEILSAVQEKLPGLPAVDAKVMGGLQTLQAISDYLAQALGAVALAVPSPTATPAPVSTPPRPALAPEAVMPVVLATVAEKTGYPLEMLEPGMQLESDLGIDSIKRVEILSAVQEKLPGLPPVDAKVMGGLQTLRAISDYLSEQLGATAPTSTSASAAAPHAAPVVATSELPVRRYVLRAVPAKAPGFAPAGLHTAKKLIITDDGHGFAPALKTILATHGIAASVSATVPADCDALILLDGLKPVTTAAESSAAHQAAFTRVQAIAAHHTAHGGLLVTVQATGGHFGLGAAPAVNSWQSGYSGLAKTAAKEWPLATVRAIDLFQSDTAPTPAEAAARLANELLYGGDELEIGLASDGTRLRLALIADELAPATGAPVTRVGKTSVVVATGGARGVTASTLIALATASQPRIALLGRTAITAEPVECARLTRPEEIQAALLARAKAAGRAPSPKELTAAVRDLLAQREIRETLAQLHAAGSAAEYFACDAQNADDVARTLAVVRKQFGAITALVHGAGVLADRLIAEKTPEQFARVFETKVLGIEALLAATAADPLDAIILFSSVAGRFGNRGQSDYAMANEVLNKVAQAEARRRGPACIVRSLNWGPWDGGMVTPALRAHFLGQGIGLIPHAGGAAAFVSELSAPATIDSVEVVIGAGRIDLSAAEGDQPTRRVEIAVSVQRYPFLADHVVKGKAVVPLALVSEWMLRAAELTRQGVAVAALHDLQVVKAVLLTDLAKDRPLLSLQTREQADGSVALRIADVVGGQLRFTASARYVSTTTIRPARSAVTQTRDADWRAFGFEFAAAYGDRLFHGPQFQVITGLHGFSPRSARLTVENRDLANSCGSSWSLGPALLDGALQSATLWTLEAHGKPALPLRIAELAFERPLNSDERMDCHLTGREKIGYGTVSDIDCVDASGASVVTLRGIECFNVDSYWNAGAV